MMGESNTRRRQHIEKKLDIPLIFQLVILLRNRKEVMYLCTRSSLALRVIGLCELAIDKNIEYRDGVVLVKDTPKNSILKDFSYYVSQVKLDVTNVVKYLNGEKSVSPGLKNLRNKIYKEMEMRSLVKIKKGLVFNKILLNNVDIWHMIFDKIVFETEDNCLSQETIALLVALNYINKLESLLLQCSESVAEKLVLSIDQITLSLDNKKFITDSQLFYDILKVLKK